ncbi:MAG: glycine cleavage system protein GcvH [Myxococcales bacterium]|jgi:glycine cleavage system H protein
MMQLPTDRLYTKDHEWACPLEGGVSVGITAFAVEHLGDITLVELNVKVGDRVEQGKTFGTIESVKALSDLFAPVSGTITQVNTELRDHPEIVNEDCYGRGWMVVVASSDLSLLSPDAYRGFLEEEAAKEAAK